jgi:hypothetical protein
LGLRRYFIKVPLFSPTLSRLWVSLITNTSKQLVYPLIESLKHQMVARDSASFYPDFASRDYLDLLKGVPMRLVARPRRWGFGPQRQTVRSVQRLEAGGRSAADVAADYFTWLPTLTYGLVRTEEIDQFLKLKLFGRLTLIELERVVEPANSDRVTYLIKKGALVRPCESARLEFRLMFRRKFVVVAIHDYAPALPWFVYRYSQALVHLGVMLAFKKKQEGALHS